ncbi:MAG: helix-turn-helix domain-containing protein [Saprospiraceae bacterium]|nr:helix-turn-helix domain-containing protein [Saprospiraceae bacterium]
MPAQILTTDDLREFKLELLKEFKNMLQQVNFNPVDPNQKKFLKSSEVAALLDISLNTLYQLRINRQLPFTKIGGTIFFESSDIEAMMAKNKKQPKMKF